MKEDNRQRDRHKEFFGLMDMRQTHKFTSKQLFMQEKYYPGQVTYVDCCKLLAPLFMDIRIEVIIPLAVKSASQFILPTVPSLQVNFFKIYYIVYLLDKICPCMAAMM